MIKLIYGSLIRPKELRYLIVNDISFANKQLLIRKEVAKNGHERTVPLTDEILKNFLDIGIQYGKGTDYIFGDGFKTCSKRMGDATLSKQWVRIRKALSLPEEMQLYSFRDTGMTDMIKNGIDPLSVKQLADHHSLEMTTIYTKHADPNLRDILNKKTPSFSSNENKESSIKGD